MKFLAILASTALLLGGCASDGAGKPASEQSGKPLPPEKRPTPEVGMTKHQIRGAWGKPKRVRQTEEGEEWQYDNVELAMIPFNFGFRPEFHIFVFGRDGLLKHFSVEKR